MEWDLILIFPPGWDTPMPPLGLWCLATYLEEHGFSVRVIDLNRVNQVNPAQLPQAVKQTVEEIKAAKPYAVGLGMAYSNFPSGLQLARCLKEEIPELTIIAGGPQVSFLRERFLRKWGDVFDVGIYSEGERTLLEVMRSLREGKALTSIPGTIIRERSRIKTNPSSLPLGADEIPAPAFGGVNLEEYPLPLLPISISRGCNRGCVFCGVIGNSVTGPYRERPLSAVIAELKRHRQNCNCSTFMFTDSLLNSRPERLRELCRLILGENLSITWIAEVFPDLSRQDLELMHAAGCRFLWIAPESGNPRTVVRMNKGVNLDRARETIRDAHEAGIFVSVWFMLGFPGETKEEIERTIAYARELKPWMDECTFTTFALMLGSPIHRHQRQYGIWWSLPLGYHTIAAYLSRDNLLRRWWISRLTAKLYDEFNPHRRFPFEFESQLGIESAPAWLRPFLRFVFRPKINSAHPPFRYADLFKQALL